MHPNVSFGPLEDADGNLINNDFSKAELFNAIFQSVFVNGDGNFPAFSNRTDVIMPTPVFAIDDVKKAFVALNSSNSCGPDGCPPIFIKKFLELSDPLCDLFKMSIEKERVPKSWKTATVIPIIQVKVQNLMLRTVDQSASLMFFCKTLERIIHGKIMNRMESEALFSQSG